MSSDQSRAMSENKPYTNKPPPYLLKILDNIEVSCELQSDIDEKTDKYISIIQQNLRPTCYTYYNEPRDRRRLAKLKKCMRKKAGSSRADPVEIENIKTVASFVPDEIIFDYESYETKSYEAALIFADVSGFTDLCEAYTKSDKDGTSRLTQVLNSFIGNMVQEILNHDGDLLKFSGDAFLAMWKSTPMFSIQEAVHAAINCALIIQRDYGSYETDVGITLKVKVAIAGGPLLFSSIGNSENSHYLVIGQPVWDVKKAEHMSKAGDVIVSPSAWKYVNRNQYIYKMMINSEMHVLIIGTSATWKNVEKDIHKNANSSSMSMMKDTDISRLIDSDEAYSEDEDYENPQMTMLEHIDNLVKAHTDKKLNKIRMCIDIAIKKNMKEPLRKFILRPVVNAIDKHEPMEYLTEMRQVEIVFVNVILHPVCNETMVDVTNVAYKEVCRIVNKRKGLVNKVSLFDKDMMFLIVFGLREMKHEKETQYALFCGIELREKLVTLDHVKSVSVGVTLGPTYCGVVGHVLRREFTVIGLCVNKAARLMVNYPDKVTCDSKVCLQSQLRRECFILMPFKVLKGLKNVGPIYEFNPEYLNFKTAICNYPMVNRSSEIKDFNRWIHNLKANFSNEFDQKYRKQLKAAFIIGEELVGKSRLLAAIEMLISDTVPFFKIHIEHQRKNEDYFLIKEIIRVTFSKYINAVGMEFVSSQFYDAFGKTLNSSQLCFLKGIFNFGIDEPSSSNMSSEVDEKSVMEVAIKLFNEVLEDLTVIGIDGSENIDSSSIKILPTLLRECQLVILLIVENNGDGKFDEMITNPNTLKINVQPLRRCHHSALVCSMLNVQAITPKLENIVQTSSRGNAGWIENFLIMLIQQGEIYKKEMSRDEALSKGCVVPHKYNFQWVKDDISKNSKEFNECSRASAPHGWYLFGSTFKDIDDVKMYLKKQESDVIKVAFVRNPDLLDTLFIAKDTNVLFLQTYDSLSPFEQLVLKCCSALGELFSRSLLLYVISPNTNSEVAKAFEKLFNINFLECAGGDFTEIDGNILIKRVEHDDSIPNKTCMCIGINVAEKRHSNLPPYSWCGYIRFKSTSIFASSYELLTESQKKNFHMKAISYFEKNTKQCNHCRGGNFNNILGCRQEGEPLYDEELKQYIASLKESNFENEIEIPIQKRITKKLVYSNFKKQRDSQKDFWNKMNKEMDYPVVVKSFSNFHNMSCKCFEILILMYTQIIEHCKQSDQIHKLYESYLECTSLNIRCGNIPFAIMLLCEAEVFIKSSKFVLPKNNIRFQKWRMNFLTGRIYSMRGLAMLEMKDYLEAEKCLGQAIDLFGCNFNISNNDDISIKTIKNTIQKFQFDLLSKIQFGGYKNVDKLFFNQVSETLSYIYQISNTGEKYIAAYNAAIWSIRYALKASNHFPTLCTAYGNLLMASILVNKPDARKLIPSALKLCIVKEKLDRLDIEHVIHLYDSIFKFRLWDLDSKEAVEMSEILLNLLKGRQTEMNIFCLTASIELAIQTKKFTKCALLLDELKSMNSNNKDCEIINKVWYFIKVLDIHLDTGYTIEPFSECVSFYMQQEDNIKKIENAEAYWTLTLNIWLRSMRLSPECTLDWNISGLIHNIILKNVEVGVFVKIRLLEGLLLYLVNMMNNKGVKEYERIKHIISNLMKDVKQKCKQTKIYLTRYYLLKAYFHFIVINDDKVMRDLEHGLMLTIYGEDLIMRQTLVHSEKAWSNRLTSEDRNLWITQCSEGQEANFANAKKYKYKIVPFTLPTPKYRF